MDAALDHQVAHDGIAVHDEDIVFLEGFQIGFGVIFSEPGIQRGHVGGGGSEKRVRQGDPALPFAVGQLEDGIVN